MAEGDEADIVLLYACCGIRHRKVKGAGAGSGVGKYQNRKQEARGPMPPWGSMVKGRRIVLLLFSAAITCSPSMYELSVLMLRPPNFFLSHTAGDDLLQKLHK